MDNLAIDILPCWMEEVGEEPVDAFKVDVPTNHYKLTLAWCLTRFWQNCQLLLDFKCTYFRKRKRLFCHLVIAGIFWPISQEFYYLR